MADHHSNQNTDPLWRLIAELSKLPGIGEKTATRLAYYILRTQESDVQALASSLLDAKRKIHLCQSCFTFTDSDLCHYCSDSSRQKNLICVVEKPADVTAIERSQHYRGTYHVLHGVLSPLDGIGPAQLRIRELMQRVEKDQVREVILAFNSSVEGETTGIYLAKLLKPLEVHTTKIAHGIPVGGVLEYMDRQTISRAIDNRIVASQ